MSKEKEAIEPSSSPNKEKEQPANFNAERLFDPEEWRPKLQQEEFFWRDKRLEDAEKRGEKILEFSFTASAKMPVHTFFHNFEEAVHEIHDDVIKTQITVSAVKQLSEKYPDLIADLKQYYALGEKLHSMWKYHSAGAVLKAEQIPV